MYAYRSYNGVIMNLHSLINDLTEELNLTAKQQFKLTAKIKRLIHHEKADVYHRYAMYAQGAPIFDTVTDPENPILIGYELPKDQYIHKILFESYKNHEHWAKLSDEEIVTWDVGSHKFK